jgi:hypothetical protein
MGFYGERTKAKKVYPTFKSWEQAYHALHRYDVSKDGWSYTPDNAWTRHCEQEMKRIDAQERYLDRGVIQLSALDQY